MLNKIVQKFKYASYFIACIILATGINSCSKNNLSVDVAPLRAPDAAAFITQTAFVNPNTYYVKSDGTPYKIAVGLTNVSTQDRAVQFTVTSSTAVAGAQYTAPAPVTIKAGTSLDTFRFTGLFAGYPTSARKDTVKIKFSGINTVSFKDSLVLIMSRYCDVIAANLIGNYTQSTDFYNGNASSKPKYTASISNWVPITATSASITIKNLGATPDNGWGYVTASGGFQASDPVITPGLSATIDWTNPANFSVTIPLQNYFNDGSGISTIKATGTFSACDNTFSIVCTVKYAGNGSSYVHTSVFNR